VHLFGAELVIQTPAADLLCRNLVPESSGSVESAQTSQGGGPPAVPRAVRHHLKFVTRAGDDIAVRAGARGKRWRSSVTVVVVSAAFTLAAALAANTVETRWRWWPLVTWTAVAALVLAAVAIERARSRVADRQPAWEEITEALADEVRQQWDREAVLRGVNRPVPLQVRWSSTGRPVAAGRDVVLDQRSGIDWRELPLRGDVEEVVGAFRELPHRQLVVLGEPGAGKTVLAILFTLGLIKSLEAGQPVPVLLPITSWDPTSEGPDEFITRRLGEEHGFLAGQGWGSQSLTELLVARGMVLPVLDGLDELPARWHSMAVEALDRYAAVGRPLVVTCRSREYEQAVVTSGSLLSRAAVVEIEPVKTEDAIGFLSEPALARSRWAPVLTHLREYPLGILAQALSTPLMVALARTAYRSPATDPMDLVKFADRSAVEGRLIDGFVASVYQPDEPSLHLQGGGRLRSYPQRRAVRWLGCLAYHLDRSCTRDLWWWQLSPGLLSRRPSLVTRLVLAGAVLCVAAGAALVAGLIAGPSLAVFAALVAGLVVGTTAAGLFRAMWPGGYPPYVPVRYQKPPQRHIHRALVRAGFGFYFGLETGFLIDAPLLGLLGGVTCGLVVAAVPPLPTPIRVARSTPRVTLRATCRSAATAAAQYGLIGGVIYGAFARLGTPLSALADGCVACLVFGLAAACGAGLWTWTQFRIAHAFLALRGWLPWRLWTFLDDAYRRGVLRQAGTAWQFRHALLQDHLAREVRLDSLRARANIGDRAAASLLDQTLAEEGRVDELRTRAEGGDPEAQHRLACVLVDQGRTDEAIALLRTRADAGDGDCAITLAHLLVDQDRIDEAIALLRTRADTGDGDCARILAHLLVRQERTHDAIATLQTLVNAHAEDENDGYWHDASWLAELLAEHGRVDDLTAWADAGNMQARNQLADLLKAQGRTDELRVRAEAGDWCAAWRLADLLKEQGRTDELRVRAEAGDWQAARHLADVLAGQGAPESEAHEALRALANRGNEAAARVLVERLARCGYLEEAIAMQSALADSGNPSTNEKLAGMLAEHGRMQEAAAVLRRFGDEFAVRNLAHSLVYRADVEHAISFVRACADAGDRSASWLLAKLLAKHGRVEELRTRADVGDWSASRRLAELLAEHGHMEELRARANAGDGNAAEVLAGLFADQGRLEEATTIFRARADAGSFYATERLADLLAKQGRLEELRTRAAAGDREATWQLAKLLAKQGGAEEILVMLRTWADSGDEVADERLARLLAAQGSVEALRARAATGNRYSAEILEEVLAAPALAAATIAARMQV
jgi:hypothetical protein